jgi:hypothetical protein
VRRVEPSSSPLFFFVIERQKGIRTMTKDKYMALPDVQSLWTNKQKPWITSNYATKTEVPEQIASNAASVDTCIDVIGELV